MVSCKGSGWLLYFLYTGSHNHLILPRDRVTPSLIPGKCLETWPCSEDHERLGGQATCMSAVWLCFPLLLSHKSLYSGNALQDHTSYQSFIWGEILSGVQHMDDSHLIMPLPPHKVLVWCTHMWMKRRCSAAVLRWPSWIGQAMIQLPTPLYFPVGGFKWAFILSWGGKAGTIPLAQKRHHSICLPGEEINILGESSYSNARGLHQTVWAVPIVCEHSMRTKTDWAGKGPTQRHSEHIQNRTL